LLVTSVRYDDPTVPLRVIVDPRIKQRWLDTRRAEGRRRLRIFLVGAGVAATLGAAVGVLYSPLFEVRHVRVQGVYGPQATQVLAAAAVAHKPLIDVHPGTVAARLDAIPWVSDATVQTQWPTTVRVRVQSRTPVAQVVVPGNARGPQVVLLDATGRVLTGPVAPIPTMPLLSGVSVHGVRPGQWIAGTVRGAVPGSPASLLADPSTAITGALALSANMPRSLAGALESITAKDGALQALVSSPTATVPVTVLLGDQSQLADKLTALATIVQQVDLAGITQIDVRIPTRPALTTERATGNVSTQAGG
jgi:cell division septal protein FtsQ